MPLVHSACRHQEEIFLAEVGGSRFTLTKRRLSPSKNRTWMACSGVSTHPVLESQSGARPRARRMRLMLFSMLDVAAGFSCAFCFARRSASCCSFRACSSAARAASACISATAATTRLSENSSLTWSDVNKTIKNGPCVCRHVAAQSAMVSWVRRTGQVHPCLAENSLWDASGALLWGESPWRHVPPALRLLFLVERVPRPGQRARQ